MGMEKANVEIEHTAHVFAQVWMCSYKQGNRASYDLVLGFVLTVL